MSEQESSAEAPRVMSSSVEVATDPATAFKVFTEEVDCWWLQGPINFHDSTRTHYLKIEPGVDGRVLEVHDPATGEGFELARITAWEPPTGLTWQSSIDDIETQVQFEEIDAGTRVTVTATITGEEIGGSAWVGMTPIWLSRWMGRRDTQEHQPLQLSKLAVAVHYRDPIAAARWLRDVFLFDPTANIPDGEFDDHTWLEFHVGNAPVIVFKREDGDSASAGVSHTPWVFVDDLDAQYANIKSNGATIVEEITHHGARWFTAADLEGNHWTFAQAMPRM